MIPTASMDAATKRSFRVVITILLVVLADCLGDPVGPSRLVLNVQGGDSVRVGDPAEILQNPVVFSAVDLNGRPIAGAKVSWEVQGRGARIANASANTASDGSFQATWQLGTSASDTQRLSAIVASTTNQSTITVVGRVVPDVVQQLRLGPDTMTTKLGRSITLTVNATDPYGNRFSPSTVVFSSTDTSVLMVDDEGVVAPHRRGYANITAVAGGATTSTIVHVVQVVQQIKVSSDTLKFHAVGAQQQLHIELIDDQGLPVVDSTALASVDDSGVVAIAPAGDTITVRSLQPGGTQVRLSSGSIVAAVPTLVVQIPATVSLSATRDTLDAFGDTSRTSAIVRDSAQALIGLPMVAYRSTDSNIVAVTSGGTAIARGNGTAWVVGQAAAGVADSVQVLVHQQIARISAANDTLQFNALHAIRVIGARALDRLGSVVSFATITYVGNDPAVGTVDAQGAVTATGNGSMSIAAISGKDSLVIGVTVQQRPVRLLLPIDTLRFIALKQVQTIAAVAVDSLGSRVPGAVEGLAVADTTIIQRLDSVTVRSRGNGITAATFTVAGLPAVQPIAVSQVPESLTVSLSATAPAPILTIPTGAPVPLTCQVFDINGVPMAADPNVTAGPGGTVSPGPCSHVMPVKSGADTLQVSLGAAHGRVPVLLAMAPTTTSPLGDFVQADSFPSEIVQFWTPTTFINSRGQMEIDFAGYAAPDTNPARANLYRLVSTDGTTFRYDGVVLPHAEPYCSPQGQGIENVLVLPRQDSAGFRMLYASGSLGCFNWQVYSATSPDGISWTREPGVRLPNFNHWFTGEGMTSTRLSDGTWQVLAGAFEEVFPSTQWSVTEWRSTDQLNWTYMGPVLSFRQMPSAPSGDTYSPTLVQMGSGLWRMFFTADDKGTSSTVHSQLWSAVSLDREHWQLEGALLASPTTNFYYASTVNNRLVYVRQDNGGQERLGIATVVMP